MLNCHLNVSANLHCPSKICGGSPCNLPVLGPAGCCPGCCAIGTGGAIGIGGCTRSSGTSGYANGLTTSGGGSGMFSPSLVTSLIN